MKLQLDIFLEKFPIEKLKKGVECECCGHTFKAFGYDLDLRFVALAEKIMDYSTLHREKTWDRRAVFGDDVNAQKHFYHLEYFGIIEPTKKQNIWKITQRGWDFMIGEIRLPSKVWIHDWRRWRKPILEEDRLIHIGEVEPRWKYLQSHWTMDFILYPHHREQQTIKLV